MEEIVQDLFEQGILIRTEVGAVRRDRPSEDAHAGAPLHIPPTVQGILAARIDRLAPEEKALLQQLAVIGREFPVSLIRQVIFQPEEELYRILSALQRKEFLYEQPAFPEVEYIFKHALTQEVAYGTVLQEQRKLLHERTGRALEALYTATLHEHYSDLAHHYRRSANTEKAIEYLQKAGQQAIQRAANAEAINHLTTALELLKILPDTLDRIQQELTLQVTLGSPLMILRGFAAPEVEIVYLRARDLCQQLGETPQLFPVLYGLWVFHFIRGETQKARELAEQFLSLTQRGAHSALLPEAYHMLGETLLWLGELVPGRVHLEQGIALYDRQTHAPQIAIFAQDSGVSCLSFAVIGLWILGFPDQALKESNDMVTLARELSHPFSLALALTSTTMLHLLRREVQASQAQVETLIALCTEQGFSYRGAGGTILRGCVLSEQERREEGIEQIQNGLTAWRATGARIALPWWLALLAEAHGKAGQVEEGLTALSEAMRTAERTGERFNEAELYRLKGELTLQQEKAKVKGQKSKMTNTQHLTPNTQAEAETCFLKAIEIAQRQQAKSLELRAVMSLARLWQQQGKHTEARQRLAEIYGWFTEGFDTKDLQEAKALLEKLA